jgi:hypothetical protein
MKNRYWVKHSRRTWNVKYQTCKVIIDSWYKALRDIDGLNRSSYSEWVAPTFIQAKNTGDVHVRLLTDFRRRNAQIKRKPLPVPKISDLLRK